MDVASKCPDSELLTSCAESFHSMKSNEYPLKASVGAIIDVFLDTVRSDLRKALEVLQKVWLKSFLCSVGGYCARKS